MPPKTPLEWALEFAHMGVPVVPIRGKSPALNGDDWHLTVTTDPDAIRERFKAGLNLGLFLGRRFVDWDADDERIRRLWHLAPNSDFTFGLAGLPRGSCVTHRWYELAKYPDTFQWPKFWRYRAQGKRLDEDLLLEIRSGNMQTMGPGSIHPDHREPVVWMGPYPPPMPGLVDLSELIDAARLVATAVAVSYLWPAKGGRNDFALWLCGGLVFHGLDVETTRTIATTAARLAGDEEADSRGYGAAAAQARVCRGDPVVGFPRLEEVFGCPNLGKHLCSMLGIAWSASGAPPTNKAARSVSTTGQEETTTTTAQPKPKPKPEPTVGKIPDTPEVVTMSAVKPVATKWCWPARFPLGRLSLLAGQGGLGKSLLTTYMAAILTTTGKWPDGTQGPLGSVLIVSAEDDPGDTIRPRLDAAGADVSKVHVLLGIKVHQPQKDEPLVLDWNLRDLDMLEAALDAHPGVITVFIDPVGSYLGGDVDAYRDNTVRAQLTPLARMASRRGIAVVLLAHVRKGTSSWADDMVLGSRAFTALCRSVQHLVVDEENKERRLLLPGKSNLSRPAPGLAFVIEDGPRIVWEEEPLTLHADDHYRGIGPRKAPGPRGDTLEAAREFLLTSLSGGPVGAKELQETAFAVHNISTRTLRRAKEDLGVIVYRPENPGPWYWRLPEATDL